MAVVTKNFSDYCQFTPKQLEAVQASDTHKFLFYGGAAGGGKSHFLRWFFLRLLLKWYATYRLRGIRVAIFCEDYPSLDERQLVAVRKEMPEQFGTYHESRREYELKAEYGGGVIAFRNLDNPQKYSSAQFAAIGIDEMTLNPPDAFWELRPRLRWKGLPGSEWRFIGTGNPVGVGIGWVKKYWIDRVYDDQNEDPSQFAFVQAKVSDNPHLPPEYAADLARLPEDRRRALLDGDWDVFKGMYFPEWRRSVHVVDPFPIPRGQGVWYRAMDWGFFPGYLAVGWYWWAPWETLYLVKELYVQRLKPSEAATRIQVMTAADEPVSITIADPACWAKNAETGKSIADLFVQSGVPLIPGNNDRLAGAARCREWLKPFQVRGEDGTLTDTSRFKVFSTCAQFIRTLPNLVHDDVRQEDVNTHGEDHLYDQWRYLVMHLPVSAAIGSRTNVPSPSREEREGYIPGMVPHDDDDWNDDRVSGW